MQLKKLIIKGFKSFAEKTTFDFNEGLTAIVGPNGSGKSNVIDAIQWVMGEQSARTLRGGKMNDVIFSGSEKRKPMNIAEVTIIFDNSTQFLKADYEEVSVTRRLTRSGESNYFINRQPARLKDVVELFLDSGLGKESFSIISQGQVEAIFNSKPENRRAIFEEAAGVFKYKLHKEEAEKKLEDTQGNLDRVQDILYELDSQVGPLREQADIASSYLEQKEKLTDIDIALNVHKIQGLTDDLQEYQESISDYKKTISDTENQLNSYVQKNEQLKEELSQVNTKRDKLTANLMEKVKSIAEAESQLALFEEKSRHRGEFLQEKEQTLAKYESNLKVINEKISNLQESKEAEEKAIEKTQNDLKQLKEKLAYISEGSTDRIEELRSDYVDYMQQQAYLNNEEGSLNRDINRYQIQNEKHASNLNQVADDLEQAESDKSEKEDQLSLIQDELTNLLDSYKELNEEIEKLSESLSSKEARLNEVNRQLNQSQAKYQSLKEMKNDYSGYYRGVRSILKNKSQLNGIIGTVAELIQIPDKYLQAIQTAIASAGQFIVVDDEKSARQAIQYLMKTKEGRATFLPLTTIKSRYIYGDALAQVKNIDGYIGVASDLIQYDQEFNHIIENLLGTTLVANDLTSAGKIAKAINYRFKVVALDGNVMNAGGSMTGGGKQTSTNPIFTQKKELKALELSISEAKETLEIREKDFEDTKSNLHNKRQELQDLREQGEQKRYQENQLEMELKTVSSNLDALKRQKKALSFEQNTVMEDLEESQNRLNEIKGQKSQVENSISETDKQINELTEAKENTSKKTAEINQEIEEIRNEYTDQREKIASIDSNLLSLENQREELKQDINETKQAIEDYNETSKVDSKEEIEAIINQLKISRNQLQTEDQELKETQTNLNKQVEEIDQEIDRLDETEDTYRDNLRDVELQKSRADVSLDHHLNYLSEEYQLSFEEAKLEYELETDISQAEKTVRLLKKGIEELGPVNLNAIEEYKKVSKRYEFLQKQQDDLIGAKTKLYDTMDEMDNEVKRRFKTTFDQIKQQFASIFPKMFGGGKAELYLTEPDDLLNTGVEIVAQPPGKKLTSLRLLSGGERALTAISLLFAIVQVVDVPFCILDEAEASLDEANVQRFARYLRNIDISTQFIVITHRKGTMEQADSLYGVTMQEKGISKLVSVRLEEVDDMDLKN